MCDVTCSPRRNSSSWSGKSSQLHHREEMATVLKGRADKTGSTKTTGSRNKEGQRSVTLVFPGPAINCHQRSCFDFPPSHASTSLNMPVLPRMQLFDCPPLYAAPVFQLAVSSPPPPLRPSDTANSTNAASRPGEGRQYSVFENFWLYSNPRRVVPHNPTSCSSEAGLVPGAVAGTTMAWGSGISHGLGDRWACRVRA